MFVYVNVFARPHLSISLDVGNAVKSPHDEDCVNTSESSTDHLVGCIILFMISGQKCPFKGGIT